MRCKLCDGEIAGYDPTFHHLRIDERHAVDICQGCIDAFLAWQGKMFVKLFPTMAMKRRHGGTGPGMTGE